MTGSVSFAFVSGVIVAAGFLFIVLAPFTRRIMVMVLALFIFVIAVVSVVSSAMQGIFVTALYTYAKTGNVPVAFDRGLIAGALLPKGGEGFPPGNR